MIKKFKFIIFILILFLFNGKINAYTILDPNGGESLTISLGGGEWWTESVGIKISIVRAEPTGIINPVNSYIIVDSNGFHGNVKIIPDKKPKFLRNGEEEWTKITTNDYIKTAHLPEDWTVSGTTTNLYKHLNENSWEKLNEILEIVVDGKKIFDDIKPDDYIVIEPMVQIGEQFGTAYELVGNIESSLNAFDKEKMIYDACIKEAKGNKEEEWKCYNTFKNAVQVIGSMVHSFRYSYQGAVFSGSSKYKNGGILYNTIFLENNTSIGSLQIEAYDDVWNGDNTKIEREKCFSTTTCGRGIGIYKASDIIKNFSGTLTITKVDEDDNSILLDEAFFKIYEGFGCQGGGEVLKPTGWNIQGKTPLKELPLGKYSFKEILAPYGYIKDDTCHNIEITEENIEVEVAVKNKKEEVVDHKLTILKVNSEGLPITSDSAFFQLYKNNSCTGTPFKTVEIKGNQTIDISDSDLTNGKIWVKELMAPSGYTKSETCYESDLSKTIKVVNTSTCDSLLNSYGPKPTVNALLALYKIYPNYNNLLNFSNPSCSVNSSCTNSGEINSFACLEANSGFTNTFNETNLSCADEKIQDVFGNYIGFCQNTLKIQNNLGTSNFYGYSGQFLIKNESNYIQIYNANFDPVKIYNSYIARANVVKTCYMIGNNEPTDKTTKELMVYFGDNDSNGIAEALHSDVTEIPEQKKIINSFINYVYEKIYNFKFKSYYLEKITGKIYNDLISTQFDPISYTEVYGLFSSLNSINGKIPFQIKYGRKTKTINSCNYLTKQQIIKDNKINLEFRIIDTFNPFNRNTNTNWCHFTPVTGTGKLVKQSCSLDNPTVQSNIINRNNSYNKTGDDPIYEITLTPADILKIREYNKDNPYDDYRVVTYVENGTQITQNAFLYSLKTGSLNTYKDNSINDIEKPYGVLTQHLIIK